MFCSEAQHYTDVMDWVLTSNRDNNIAFAFAVGAALGWIHVASEDGINLCLGRVSNLSSDNNQGTKLLRLDTVL